jgi:hypothetical protein
VFAPMQFRWRRGRRRLSQEIDGILNPLKFHVRADYTVLGREWKSGTGPPLRSPQLGNVLEGVRTPPVAIERVRKLLTLRKISDCRRGKECVIA